MSGAGAPKLAIDASGLQVAIVVTSWHTQITDGLLAGAERALQAAGNSEYEIWRVPGAFELPLGAQYAIDAGADVVIALGVVIQGDTPHFDYVCQGVTQGIMEVSLKFSAPIGFGVLMCNTLDQAIARSGRPGSVEDKGYDSAIAALALMGL